MILLVTPHAPGSTSGNGVSAARWAAILRGLGHRVETRADYRSSAGEYAALFALHARKSAAAVLAFHADRPGVPIVIALTGTDLYPDPRAAGTDPEVLALAARLIVLQRLGPDRLGPDLAARARVIVQSVPEIPPRPPRAGCFEAAFLAHVRPVKDPLRPAAATRLLPADSRVLVTHAGEARDRRLAERLAAESAANPRYDWLGPVPRDEALAILARARLLVLPSLHEGGANVVSEAIAAGVPVIASAVPGSIGLLGEDYPGYFPAGDAQALAAALYAAERNLGGYYDRLREHCAALRPLVDPARERRAFAALLAELGVRPDQLTK